MPACSYLKYLVILLLVQQNSSVRKLPDKTFRLKTAGNVALFGNGAAPVNKSAWRRGRTKSFTLRHFILFSTVFSKIVFTNFVKNEMVSI